VRIILLDDVAERGELVRQWRSRQRIEDEFVRARNGGRPAAVRYDIGGDIMEAPLPRIDPGNARRSQHRQPSIEQCCRDADQRRRTKPFSLIDETGLKHRYAQMRQVKNGVQSCGTSSSTSSTTSLAGNSSPTWRYTNIGGFEGLQMAAIARALSRTFPNTRVDIEVLRTIAMFCAVGLTVSLLAASYGLDLSAGFF